MGGDAAAQTAWMASVDLVNETFIVATPAAVAARIHDPALWRRWWPDLELTVFADRLEAGLRWTVTGALVGSAELWLEPWGDGVIVHHYLRADPTRPGSGTEAVRRRPRQLDRLRRAQAMRSKRHILALKDELEAGRAPGTGRAGLQPEPLPADEPAREP